MEYSTHFESFWIRYGSEETLSSAGKGSKFKAQESWTKIGKQWAAREKQEFEEQSFAQMVWRGYEAQKANRRAMRQAKQFVPQLPHVTTWLNGWRFEQEIDQPTGELRRQSMVERRCDVSGCTEFPIGRSFEGGWICRTHDLKIWGDQNREAFRALLAKHPRDRDESWRDWSWRTMAQCPIGCDLLLRMNIRVNRELDSTQKTDAEMRVAHYARLEEYANRTGDNNARRAAIEEQLRKIRAETAAQRAQVVE